MGLGNSAIAGEMRPAITSADIDGGRITRVAMTAIRRHADGVPPSEEPQVNVGFRLIAR